MATHTTHHATLSNAQWLLDLFYRVQAALIASGSLQQLTVPSLLTLQNTITNRHIYIFSKAAMKTSIGTVTISPFSPDIGHGSLAWGVVSAWKGKIWYLHSLMLEPQAQGQGLGIVFLKEVMRLLGHEQGEGLVVLDCWAGNEKLRGFYRKAGFQLFGKFPEGQYEIVVFVLEIGEMGDETYPSPRASGNDSITSSIC